MKPLAINALNFEAALEHYRAGRDDEEACTDLITDAMHFMAFNFLNISTVLSRARMHFDQEAAVVTDESVGAERYRPIVGSSMTATGHSPAPWGYDYSPYQGPNGEIPAFEIVDADCNKIFDTNEDAPTELQEANARLAATAPTLLEELSFFLDFAVLNDDGEDEDFTRHISAARVAIAEATGRPA
jgi:hypothetical protein